MFRHPLALLVAAVFAVGSFTGEARALSTASESWIDLLRDRNPEKAERIERQLKEIEESKLSDLEKKKRTEQFLFNEREKAAEEIKAAQQFGSPEGQSTAWEVYFIVTWLHILAHDDFWEYANLQGAGGEVPERGSQSAPLMRVKEAIGEEKWYDLYQQSNDKRLQKEAQLKEAQKAKESGAEPKKSSMAPTPQGDTYFAMAPAFVFGNWRGPVQVHMGFENSLAQQTFAIEGQKRSDGFTGFDFHTTAGIDQASALHLGVNTYELDFSGAHTVIDPLGQRLLFPGVTSAGFFLPSNVAEGVAGGNNVADNVRYNFNSDTTTFYGAYSMACDHGPYDIIGYGGLVHTISDQHQRLEGRIPGFGFLPFAYDTSFDTDVTRGMVGTRVIRQVDMEALRGLSLNAGATAFLNYVDTNGRDSLLLGATFEERDIGKNAWTFGWSAGVGAELAADRGWTLFANYRYIDDEVTPIAVRQDTGPSHAEIERAHAHVGMLGARLAF